MNPLTPLKFIVAAVIVVSLGGCLSQPTDAVTGKAFGPALHAGDPAPTTSPAGNGVVEKSTSKIDTYRVVDTTNGVIQTSAPAFGPWGVIIATVSGLLVDQLHRRRNASQAMLAGLQPLK